MGMKIRPANPSDEKLLGHEPALHRFVAVSGEDQHPVGEIAIDGSPLDGDKQAFLEIIDLYVKPDVRRQGVGMALLNEACKVASAYERRAIANVPHDASDAIQLFHRAGWVQGDGNAAPGSRVFMTPVPGASDESHWQIETTAIHAGVPEEELGPVTPPIALSSTYRVSHPGSYGRWAYARSANPTRNALEEALAAIEGGAGAGAFSSGLAAIDAVLRFLEPGSRIVVSNDVYGGTWRLLNTVWDKVGFPVQAVDLTDLDAARAALDGAGMLIAETPSNPLLRILDIRALADAAHSNGALFVVDNTFASPYLQHPLELGADLVTHSSTKYLGGHSDLIGGALVAKSPEHADRIHYLQRAVGAVQSPFDSYLVLRGIRTLPVRMDRHCENATAMAEMLANHPAVASVLYPGLTGDPGYDLMSKQMRAGGGMVSFRHAGGAVEARRMSQRVKLFTLAESLGAVESLIEVPAAMTHAVSTGSLLEVPDDLVRLSVGLENIDDLIADVRQALEQP